MSKKQRRGKTTSTSRSKRRGKQRQGIQWLWIGLAGLALILGATFIFLQQEKQSALPAEISAAHAYQMYQNGAFFLDVRTQEEWALYHIKNSVWIPLEELSGRLDEVPTDKDIVVTCRTGNRSQEARDILLKASFKRVTSLYGGVEGWRMAGYSLATGP